MIERYFIGVKAKSKGYVKSLSKSYLLTNNFSDKKGIGNNFPHSAIKELKNISPAFTQQTALALSFYEREKAEETLLIFKLKIDDLILYLYDRKSKILDIDQRYSTLDFNDKVIELTSINIRSIPLNTTQLNQFGFVYGTTVNLYYPSFPETIRTFDQFSNEEREAIERHSLENVIESLDKNIQAFVEYRDYLDTLIIRKETLSLKFLRSHKSSFREFKTGVDNTSHTYCNKCGYAVPNMSYIRLTPVNICVICLSKMAKDAQQKLNELPNGLLEHYETDVFLNEI